MWCGFLHIYSSAFLSVFLLTTQHHIQSLHTFAYSDSPSYSASICLFRSTKSFPTQRVPVLSSTVSRLFLLSTVYLHLHLLVHDDFPFHNQLHQPQLSRKWTIANTHPIFWATTKSHLNLKKTAWIVRSYCYAIIRLMSSTARWRRS